MDFRLFGYRHWFREDWMVSCISYQGEFTKRARAWNRICRLYLVLTSIRYENLAWSLALGLRNLEPKGPFNLPIPKSYLAFWEPNWAYQVFWCMHHSIIWQQIWVWNPNFGWIQAAYGRSGRGSVSQRKPELLRASDSLGILCFATANNLLNLLFAIFLIPKCFSVNCLMLL